MEKEFKEEVPYFVFEGELTRMERVNHRLWIMCILLLAVLLGTNAGWLYYESQWETVSEQEFYEISSDRGHAVYNESGEVSINGYEGESDQDETEQTAEDGR